MRETDRRTPFGAGYRPQFFFGVTDVTGAIGLGNAEEAALVQPGERRSVGFRLDKPVAFEAGTRFALRDGSRTIGAGRVTRVC